MFSFSFLFISVSPCLRERIFLADPSVDDSGDAFLHQGLTEIQKITDFHSGQAQVGEQLFLMRIGDVLDGLEFQDNFAVDDHVGSEAFLEFDALVDDRHRHLSLHRQIPPLQLVGQHCLIDTL